jgi:hypothetical protein
VNSSGNLTVRRCALSAIRPLIEQQLRLHKGPAQFPRPLDDVSLTNAPGGDGTDIGAFEVDPNFRIVDLRRAGNDVALSMMTMLGRNYPAGYTNDLGSGNWTIFTNNAPGNGWLLWVAEC